MTGSPPGPLARTGMELTPRASISSRRCPMTCLSPPDAARAPAGRVARPPVEPGQPVDAAECSARDLVELVFQRGGEVVVDQLGEVLLQQVDDGEGDERGHQGGARRPDDTRPLA